MGSRAGQATTLAGMLAVSLLAGALGVSGGCESSGGSTAISAAPMQDPMLEGIPVPNGFALRLERSVGRKSGPVRVANHTYLGGSAPVAVTRFYREYMPSAGFTLRSERLERGTYYMRFDSDSEECNVSVAREGGKTVLVLDVGPIPQGTAEREVKPPVRRERPARPAQRD